MVLKGKITQENCNLSIVYEWQRNPYYVSTAWPPKIAAQRTRSHVNIILSVKEHGQEQPIDLQEHLEMMDPWDGFHRIAVLNHFDMKYVYGKDVIPDVWPERKS